MKKIIATYNQSFEEGLKNVTAQERKRIYVRLPEEKKDFLRKKATASTVTTKQSPA